MMFRRGWRNLKLPAADFWRIVLIGVLGMAASNYLYYLAIKRTNVATAIILQYTAPVLVLLYMVARGLQKATAQRVAAVLLSVLGSALAIGVVGRGLRLDAVGVMAALLAAVSFAFYNIAGHRILARYDRWIVPFHTTFSAGAFWLIVTRRGDGSRPTIQSTGHFWQCSRDIGARSLSFYFAGLQHLEPTVIVASRLELLHPAGSPVARRTLRPGTERDRAGCHRDCAIIRTSRSSDRSRAD
jgi:drug/metabolite transporter (DMT)-like permease